MCGRYALIAGAEVIRRIFELPLFDERLVVPRYNIAPTQPIAIVRGTERGRELIPVRWGFVPAWADDFGRKPLLVNARAEGIAAKPAYRNAFRRRRCLVPASAFYEWQARGKGPKQPFAARPADAELIAFAGLWETWCGKDGSEIDTAAIITVGCNDCLRTIHERMPAVIAPEDFGTWLSPETELHQAEALLRPAPEALFTCSPISNRVNQVANDDAALWQPLQTEMPAEAAKREPEQPYLPLLVNSPTTSVSGEKTN
jgi:putative SOS response-associated peptidase YedK